MFCINIDVAPQIVFHHTTITPYSHLLAKAFTSKKPLDLEPALHHKKHYTANFLYMAKPNNYRQHRVTAAVPRTFNLGVTTTATRPDGIASLWPIVWIKSPF